MAEKTPASKTAEAADNQLVEQIEQTGESNGRGVESNGRGVESSGRGVESNGRGVESSGRGVESNGRGVKSAAVSAMGSTK